MAILNLNDLIDSTEVRVNADLTVTLKRVEQLPPLQSHAVGVLGRRLDELARQPALSPDEADELAGLPARICAMVLVGGDASAAKLNPDEQWAIVRSFSDPRTAALTKSQASSVENTTGA